MPWIGKICMGLLRLTATASLHSWLFGFTLFAYLTQAGLERIRWLHAVAALANPLTFTRYTVCMRLASQAQHKLRLWLLLVARIAHKPHF